MNSRLVFPSVSVLAALPGMLSAQENPRPNIVYIMSDDHACQAISAYGHGLNHTPNIDRIAAEGVLFTNSYVSNSISGPSRAVMLTGKFSHKNGFRDNRPSTVLDGSQQTFPKLLRAAGYRTAVIGKWHLGSTPTGFDYYSVHVGQGTYYSPEMIEPDGNKIYEGSYSTQLTVDKSIEWLEGADTSQPFCLLMHFKAPHRNWMPAPDKMAMYEDTVFPLPVNFNDDYEGRRAAAEQKMNILNDMHMEYDMKLVGTCRPEGSPDILKELDRMTPDQREAFDAVYGPIRDDFDGRSFTGDELAVWKYQRYMRDYMKTIASVDEAVGKMIDYLKDNGLWENTVVVYTSDQGFYLGEHGWFDKRFMYEESFRTPLMVSCPSLFGQSIRNTALVQNIDYAPTFLEIAGVDIPSGIQGESLMDLLKGKKKKVHDAIYYHYYEFPDHHAVKRHYGVRDSRYKLIHFYCDIDTWELYDLHSDPHEMNNVIEDPAYVRVKKKMHNKLRKLQSRYDDTNPTGDGYPWDQDFCP